MKKLFCFVLAVTLSLSIVSSYTFNETTVYAEDEDISEDTGNIAGYAAGSVKTINDIIDEYKFSYSQGHGFAAERGNNLADILKGEDASVVGDNNLKNGEDRIIKNTDGTITFIQDKYYKDVSQGINACFENGKFRYVDANENAMQIEVPSDRYEEAVEIMRGKIEAGNLENVGITDPDEAETLVRKGNLTYQQAKNLAKAGTIESLKYDATNGIISAGYAIGISAVINYAVCRLNGYSNKEALETAAIQGLKTGGVVFATSVIAAQFSRTNAKFLMPSSEALVNVLGEDFANAIVKVYARDGVAVGQSAMRYAAKVLRNQALTAGITVIILSASDVVDLFRGRISPEQLVKNLIVTSAGVSGGYIGWTAGSILGSSIVPGVGTYVGGVAGSVVGGGAASIISDKVLSAFIKDDADEMYEIIENEFETLCVDYMVNDEEADAITDELSDLLSTNKLKEMYASDDRENYAAIMMEPLFETQVSNRDEIEIPTEEEMRNELISDLDDVVYLH